MIRSKYILKVCTLYVQRPALYQGAPRGADFGSGTVSDFTSKDQGSNDHVDTLREHLRAGSQGGFHRSVNLYEPLKETVLCASQFHLQPTFVALRRPSEFLTTLEDKYRPNGERLHHLALFGSL